MRRQLLVPALVSGWLLASATGMTLLWRYKLTPAEASTAPPTWPAASRIARDPRRPTLVMLAHPLCPCSRASVGELSRLVARSGDRVKVVVSFLEPEDGDADWLDSDLVRTASTIPGATVVGDRGGREAARFGAHASGQVVLYDAAGRLAFQGGITGARGHFGDNAGRRRAASIILTGGADRADSPVFGCAMAAHDPDGASGRGNGIEEVAR